MFLFSIFEVHTYVLFVAVQYCQMATHGRAALFAVLPVKFILTKEITPLF